MATVGRDLVGGTRRGWRPGRWTAIGVAALVTSKLADALTTSVGLLYLPMHEANPVLRALFAEVSVLPGLAIASLVVVAGLTVITETGATLARRTDPDPRWARRVRYVGYGIPTLVFTVVSAHNLVLILSLL